MKIAFSRINNTNYPFKLNLENVVFEGNLVKVNPKLVKINATMQGFVYRPCDSCGEELELEIKKIWIFLQVMVFLKIIRMN